MLATRNQRSKNSGSSISSESSSPAARKRKRSRSQKKMNGDATKDDKHHINDDDDDDDDDDKIPAKKPLRNQNLKDVQQNQPQPQQPQQHQRRRNSASKAARDPRDQPTKKQRASLSRAGTSTIASSSASASASATASASAPPPSIIDPDGLSRPAKDTRLRLHDTLQEAAARTSTMQQAVRTLIGCLGEDPDREGLRDSPARYANAMLSFTSGYAVNVDDLVNNALFNEGHNEMIVVKDIDIYSLCEHHLVPFFGKMHIAYIPRNTVIGLSKLPRIAQMYARRLQVQERLTKDVAHCIMDVLDPQGVAVVMQATHLCMVMRGVEQTATSTITSCVLGCFERKSKTRNEFLSLVGINR